MKTILCAFFMVFFTGVTFSQKQSNKHKLISFSELDKVTDDTVRLKVYVLDIYICPPCPEGMQCKPCIGNNFMAVEEKPVDIFKISPDKKLRVLTEHPDSLKVANRYMISIRIINKKVKPVNEVELVSYKPL